MSGLSTAHDFYPVITNTTQYPVNKQYKQLELSRQYMNWKQITVWILKKGAESPFARVEPSDWKVYDTETWHIHMNTIYSH